MTVRAWPVFSKEGLGYFTNDKFDQVNNVYGAKAYIYGTSWCRSSRSSSPCR